MNAAQATALRREQYLAWENTKRTQISTSATVTLHSPQTAAAWTAANPILLNGEIGLESDTHKIKLGDGVTAWNSLAYSGTSELPSGVIIMWSGREASIPAGWLLCDGTNGTPDLSSLFIIES